VNGVAQRKYMKKLNKKTLKAKADKVFSLWVRRTIGYCQAHDGIKCSNTLQTAHIVTRGNLTLRYHPENVLCLCSAHHFWYHRHPLEFVEMLLDRFPKKYTYIQKHKNELTKMTIEDYQKIIKSYS
jgi:hypothetical protein